MGDPGEFVPPPVDEDEGDDEGRRGPAWLPWVVFAIIVLIVAWLLWRYADFGNPEVPVTKSVQVTATVPDVIGLTAEEAGVLIESAGFDADSETIYGTDQPEGVVANQEPAGGTQLVKGGTVNLGVSAGLSSETGADDEAGYENGVPDVIGLSEDLAIEALKRSGYNASVGYSYGDQDQGVVWAQSPEAMAPAANGSTVRITVSLGRRVRRVTMPNVIGLSESAAMERIVAAGLSPRPTYQPKVDQVGKVYQQSPNAGTELDEGTLAFYLIGVRP